jgi:hypothetical protein
MPQLKVVAPLPSRPFSTCYLPTDAEAAVKQLVEQRTAAVREREELMGPVTRLQGVIAAAEVEERTVAECRAAEDAAMDAWLAGDGSTPQPQLPSAATKAAEENLALARNRISAAQRALPAATAAVEACNIRIGEISREIQAAVSALAVEKLADFAERGFAPAVAAALRAEATMAALEQALWPRGQGPAAVRINTFARAKAGLGHNSRALSDSDAIVAGSLYEKARAAIAVDVGAAERFIGNLTDDPAAAIE